MILLGTGTSVGVPAIGCGCPVCRSDDARNHRTRCAVALGLPEGNLLIDTPPDLRAQLLREGIGIIHAVLFTHEHADHIFGLDDLRLFPFYLGKPVPLYCTQVVEARIRESFSYAFTDRDWTHAGAAPRLRFHQVATEPFDLLGARITPIPMEHGPHFETLGFRVGNVAYCTDTNHIADASLALLGGLDVLVLDALRFRPHPTHFGLDEALRVAEALGPKRTILTHMGHDFDYAAVTAQLPESVELGYDTMRIRLT